MEGFMPCPESRPLASYRRPDKYHKQYLNDVSGMYN